MMIRSIYLKILSKVASVISTILLIWLMSPEVFGMFVTLSSILLVTLTATANGVSIAVTREYILSPTDSLSIKSIFQRIIYLSLISFCITYIFYHSFYIVSFETELIIVVAAFCVSEVFLYYTVGILRGKNKLFDAVVLETCPIIIFTIMLVFTIQYEPSIILVLLLKLVSNALFSSYGAFKVSQILYVKANSAVMFSTAEVKSLLEAIKLGFSMSINRCLSVTDVLVISSLLGLSSIAQYKLSVIPLAVMTIPSFLNVSMLYGNLQQALSGESIGDLKEKLRNIYVVNLMLLTLCLLGLIVYSFLISKFEIPNKMHIDVSITVIGVVGYFIWNCFGPTNATLILLNAENFLLKLNIILVISNVIVSYYSIFLIGIDGPIISTMIMMIFSQILKIFYSHKYPSYIRLTAYDIFFSHSFNRDSG